MYYSHAGPLKGLLALSVCLVKTRGRPGNAYGYDSTASHMDPRPTMLLAGSVRGAMREGCTVGQCPKAPCVV